LQQELIAALIVSVVAFFVVYAITPFLIRELGKRKLAVPDVNRIGGAMVPRPGGPAIIAAILISEAVLFLIFPSEMRNLKIIALMITTLLAFIVGFIDDRRVMGGWFKPLALAVSAIPLVLIGIYDPAGVYDPNLTFPIFGSVKIPALYIGIIILMIPITGNTINSIDVMNGIASGFMTIASFSLTISLLIMQNYDVALISLPLGFASLAFYKYHKFPSRIFPGDSGALTLGAMYGVIAIIGHAEVVAAIALLPAVINSFLFLSSVKKIVEHRQIKNPTTHTEDHKIIATKEKDAPITLVRLLVAGRPLTEKEIGFTVFKLAIFSGILAIITAFLMEVRI
jgi:UDP-N-acetylmuramyl pentapeptide phosphotransferase/UDP-N-acetylglucosamine-1-phosphate transferase